MSELFAWLIVCDPDDLRVKTDNLLRCFVAWKEHGASPVLNCAPKEVGSRDASRLVLKARAEVG